MEWARSSKLTLNLDAANFPWKDRETASQNTTKWDMTTPLPCYIPRKGMRAGNGWPGRKRQDEKRGVVWLDGLPTPTVLTTDANYHLALSCVVATLHTQRSFTATPGFNSWWVAELGHKLRARGPPPPKQRVTTYVSEPSHLHSATFSLGGISTLFGDFIRHFCVFLDFINLAMLPFLFLAFAGPDGGSIVFLFFLIFPTVLLTTHLYLTWVLQAAAVSLSCCFLLTWTMWKLWTFLDEAKARYQNRLETNIVLQYCLPRGQKGSNINLLFTPEHSVDT